MKIAITGHRPNKLGNDYDLTSELIKKIKYEIQVSITKYNDIGKEDWTPVTLITGMALGIDQLFAQIAIENNIPFIAAIPCKGQEIKWPLNSKLKYYKLLEEANGIFIVNENRWALFDEFRIYKFDTIKYTSDCMQKRNEWMVDNCDVLIAVWDGSKGGTGNCVQHAKSINKKIIHINPRLL